MEADCAMVVALQFSGKELIRNFEKGVQADGLNAFNNCHSLSYLGFEHTNILGSSGPNFKSKTVVKNEQSFLLYVVKRIYVRTMA